MYTSADFDIIRFFIGMTQAVRLLGCYGQDSDQPQNHFSSQTVPSPVGPLFPAQCVRTIVPVVCQVISRVMCQVSTS